MNKSQIETSRILQEFVSVVCKPNTVDALIEIRDKMYAYIKIRPYDETTKEDELSVRWKRTASQILEDGYVYHGKSCTDLSILFIALCNVLNLETRLVKLKKETNTHSIVEVNIQNNWYMFDVSEQNTIPEKGEVTETTQYKGWQLWKKGRDAWDLGLLDSESIHKINLQKTSTKGK